MARSDRVRYHMTLHREEGHLVLARDQQRGLRNEDKVEDYGDDACERLVEGAHNCICDHRCMAPGIQPMLEKAVCETGHHYDEFTGKLKSTASATPSFTEWPYRVATTLVSIVCATL